jgi:hypothetical protein
MTRSSPPAAPERFSPLYWTYNGFLLGEFLSLSFSDFGRPELGERSRRMREFLTEIGVDVAIPEDPPRFGSDDHGDLVVMVISEVSRRSPRLADFALLGALLGQYGIQALEDPEMSGGMREQIEAICARYHLPAPQLQRFALEPEGGTMDSLVSPSLEYLADVVTALDVEVDTAFVIMPFREPYSSFYGEFYRPSLERAGRRALRAWGGLATEDYCGLLLRLIAKSGMVWADVSELNNNVFYELGAAHALDKPALIVVREGASTRVPANIGHDVVVRYSDGAPDWPRGAIALMAEFVSQLETIAVGRRHGRVASDVVRKVLEDRLRSEPAQEPPAVFATRRNAERPGTGPFALEATTASEDGWRLLGAADYPRAEAAFVEAIRLGLHDVRTRVGCGWSRLEQGRPGDAEADFDVALADLPDGDECRGERAAILRGRGLARDAQDNLEGALADYNAVVELGAGDAEIYLQRANVLVELGRCDEASSDAARVRALAPDADGLREIEEAIRSDPDWAPG